MTSYSWRAWRASHCLNAEDFRSSVSRWPPIWSAAYAMPRWSWNSSAPARWTRATSRVAAFEGGVGLVSPPACGDWLFVVGSSDGVLLQVILLLSSDCGAAGLADRPS